MKNDRIFEILSNEVSYVLRFSKIAQSNSKRKRFIMSVFYFFLKEVKIIFLFIRVFRGNVDWFILF